MKTWLVLLFVAFFSLRAVAALFASEASAAAQWISAEGPRDQRGAIRLSRGFTSSGEAVSASLQVAAEFARTRWTLNGQGIVDLDDFAAPRELDVLSKLRRGKNELLIDADRSGGPAAIAATLTIRFSDGRTQSVVTDSTWRVRATDATAAEHAARAFGSAAADAWTRTTNDAAISPFDNYEQWRQALGTPRSADPSKFLVPAGFEIELVRAAREGEGSWIGLACDPRGRLIIGREDQGLLRVTLGGKEPLVESIEDSLKECRGVLYAHDSLYVSANVSEAVFRLRDRDGDDQFETVEKLFSLPGRAGHGRNSLAAGPDGRVYLISGDSVPMPKDVADRTSPFSEHRHREKSNDGFLLAFDADGSRREIISVGLRNPYGIAFNPAGDVFTYDADAEKDMGAPWYRPTRVNHLTAGADFGWRGVTGSWPPYYPENPGNGLPTLDIGKGSPTAVMFGTASHFPPRDRRSLFILDWSYGRIVRVELTRRGAGYVGHASTFVKGRPFNVTSLAFGNDGAMYVVTGGRKTQSGLYRIRYVGSAVQDESLTEQQRARATFSDAAHQQRRQLEDLLSIGATNTSTTKNLDDAWLLLDSADPWLRHAARCVVERHAVELWRDRALRDNRPWGSLTALLALVRANDAASREPMLARLNELPFADRSPAEKETLAYLFLTLASNDGVPASLQQQTTASLLRAYPDTSAEVNSFLSRALAKLNAALFVAKAIDQLEIAATQAERLHYLFVLREVSNGWTPRLRERYFANLASARGLPGGEGLPQTYQRLVKDSLAALSENERQQHEKLLTAKPVEEALPLVNVRPVVRRWRAEDLAELTAAAESAKHVADVKQGRELFSATLCARCHRFGTTGSAMGPDLTAVARRFSRRDILESIVSPSKVVAEQYRTQQITTTDGRVIVGQLVAEEDFRSTKLHVATNPLDPRQIVEIDKSDIDTHVATPVSPMPEGLLNTLTREEIWDLLAYLETAGL